MGEFSKQRFEKSGPHVVSEEIDGEIISINLDSGSYYSMRGTAARTWLLLQSGFRIVDVVEDLRAAYDNMGPDAPQQIIEFAESLIKEGLLRVSPDKTGLKPDSTMIPPPPSPENFAPPGLETYTDMQDFLLVDPIHEIDVTHWPPKRNDSSIG